MLGVILAGGKGRRLQPITSSRPKALVPVLGKPIISKVIESLAGAGVDEFLIVVNPNDEQTPNILASQLDLNIQFDVVYQEEPLGMGNALLCAAYRIRDDFILSACDNIVSHDDLQVLLTEWQHSEDIAGVLSLIQVQPQELHRVGAVSMDGTRVTRIVEKPTPESAPSLIASIPLYIFSTRILDYLPEIQPSTHGEYELQDAIQMLIDDGYVIRGVPIQARHTVNDLDDLLRLNLYYFGQQKDLNVVKSDISNPDVQIRPPVYIDANVEIESGCEIGPCVFIERNSRIGTGSSLSNAIVLMNGLVPPGSIINHGIVT